MDHFVAPNSIVRTIWGKGDTILFIFGGSSAEFALNKAVDWLYFTGKLPADPLGRLFSTVTYARKIVFAPTEQAHKAIDSLRAIHTSVENSRGTTIPDWAYRDVLFMLIHYSIASYEVLERKLTEKEKAEVFDVFNRVGIRMGLKGLPQNYNEWLIAREEHLQNNLQKSHHTIDLYRQYKKHLGYVRYFLLIEAQKLVVPPIVKKLLQLGNMSFISIVIPVYQICKKLQLDWLVKSLFIPKTYKKELKNLDIKPAG